MKLSTIIKSLLYLLFIKISALIDIVFLKEVVSPALFFAKMVFSEELEIFNVKSLSFLTEYENIFSKFVAFGIRQILFSLILLK